MKIRLLKDLYHIDHVPLEQIRPPTNGKEVPSVTNVVRKDADEDLDVEIDATSEKAEHADGYTWFVLLKTGQRFKISNNDFIAEG
jgi:hypothetical protein